MKGVIQRFIKGEYKSQSDVVVAIRKVYSETLLDRSYDFFLSDTINGYSIRSWVWEIMLPLPQCDYAVYKRYLTISNKEVAQVRQEAERSYNKFPESDPDELFESIVTYNTWRKMKGLEFDQCAHLFPKMFLMVFPLVQSFFAFVSFAENGGAFYFRNGHDFTEILKECWRIVEIANPDVALKFDGIAPWIKENLISFSNVSSIFTQMRPATEVLKLWDMIVVYGIHMVCFLQAQWIIANHEHLVKSKGSTTDLGSQEIKAKELQEGAIKLFETVSKKNPEMIDNLISMFK